MGAGALRESPVSSGRRRRSLEAHVHAKGAHYGRVHVLEAVIGAQFLVECGFHDLAIDGKVEPWREHGVVIDLHRVLDVEAEAEVPAQEGKELAAELSAGPAHAHVVVGPARHHAVGAQPHVVRVLDWIGVAVGDAEPEEEAHALVRAPLGTPQVLIEVVVHGPGAAYLVRRHHGDEKLREEVLEESPQERSGILEAREPLRQEEACQVGRILVEGEPLLVAPDEAEILMPHQPEWLDGNPTLGVYKYSVLEGLGDVVLGTFVIWIDDRDGEDRPLPGKEDEASSVGAEGNEVQHDV